MFGRETRQALGCGYEMPDPKIPVRPWSPSSLPNNEAWQCVGKTSPDPTVCPGYSISLPETLEVVRAYTHWSNGGGLRDFAAEPTETLKIGVEIFSGAVNECQRWSMDNPQKKDA